MIVVIFAIFSAIGGFVALMEFVVFPDKGKPSSSKERCRGLVVVKHQSHDLKKDDDGEKLFVRVDIENRSKIEVSDPVVRVNVLDASGRVIETFQRTIYGGSIPPGTSSWFRIADTVGADSSKFAEIRSSVESAECKARW